MEGKKNESKNNNLKSSILTENAKVNLGDKRRETADQIKFVSPSNEVLLKYGFKEVAEQIKGCYSYEAEFINPNCKGTLFFSGGVITVNEETDIREEEIFTRCRLNRIQLENDNELDVILRQTFPSIAYKLKS